MIAAEQILFYMFAMMACGGAVGVVVTQNVVRMAFWLIISLGSTAGLFFLLSADFVGATQLLIYVGGTLVLLVFGVMLTASGPFTKIKTSPAESFLAGAIGILFFTIIVSSVTAVDWNAVNLALGASPSAKDPSVPDHTLVGFNKDGEGNTARLLGAGLLGVRPDKDLGKDASQGVSTGYLLPFEIASIHLLVVLIGAAYLARAKRRATASAMVE